MNKTINHLIVAVLVTAIGRGIVAAFGLDALVAHLIERGLQISATSTIAQAAAWIIAGFLGLVTFIWYGEIGLISKASSAARPPPSAS